MMNTGVQKTYSDGRLDRLSKMLEMDPLNAALLSDTADAAFEEKRYEEAGDLIRRLEGFGPLPGQMQHLAGLIAMQRQDWEGSARSFEALLASGADAPPVRFNLAWSLAMLKRHAEALTWLDRETSVALPQAAQLEIELLHELGQFDLAIERARELLAVHPTHRGLNAATSTLAIDTGDDELAARSAKEAGDHPAALTTLGTLALGHDQPKIALELFDAALARNPAAARAWIGRGLVRMVESSHLQAAAELDRGAELFGSHLGSWIAAGWAHLIAGNIETAKARFSIALSLDDTFGEIHGSLAVIDILEGRPEDARRRNEIALRLDRRSFSAALASTLLAAGSGDPDGARRIFERALNTPVDDQGRTVAQSLARLAVQTG